MNELIKISKELSPGERGEQVCFDSGAPGPGELELINRHSRRKLSAAEVFVFSVVLCDNEIDRDFERFTIDALRGLSHLFVGKTGIFDHSMKGRDQLARIFSCRVEEEPGRLTAAGEPYHRLKARAYLPRIAKNEEIILEIDAGIKKEVSVGCAVRSSVCSVCGVSRQAGGCSHIPGREYSVEGKTVLCHTLLGDPADAFEWSFVAVPAQRGAGVVKSFAPAEQAAPSSAGESEDPSTSVPKERAGAAQPAGQASPQDSGVGGIALSTLKKALSAGGSITREQGAALLCHLQELEKAAALGTEYRKSLQQEILRLCALCHPELSGETMKSVVEGLPVPELQRLRDAYLASADKILPSAVQLPMKSSSEEQQSNQKFMI